jgi:hypothetical protein
MSQDCLSGVLLSTPRTDRVRSFTSPRNGSEQTSTFSAGRRGPDRDLASNLCPDLSILDPINKPHRSDEGGRSVCLRTSPNPYQSEDHLESRWPNPSSLAQDRRRAGNRSGTPFLPSRPLSRVGRASRSSSSQPVVGETGSRLMIPCNHARDNGFFPQSVSHLPIFRVVTLY